MGVVSMRRNPGEWARLSALASLVAFGALLTMTLALRLVHGSVWGDGLEDPTVFHQVLVVGVAIPFLAAPGVVVGWTAGARGWRLWTVALASTLVALGGDLVTVASPVAIWAGMVVGTLLGVVSLPLLGVVSLPPSQLGVAPDAPGGGRGPAAGQRTTGSTTGGLSVLLDPPPRRLVPRDALAPQEGWEVPEALPPRPSRREIGVEVDAPDGSSGPDRPVRPAARREQASSR
jgi:hypothetical protein